MSRRARAALFGLGAAALLLVAAEAAGRHHAHMVFPADEPGRGYATVPFAYGTNGGGFLEREVAAGADPTVRRVAVLGDSMTYGTGTAEEAYTRAAEARLGAGWQVLNFAQYGYDAAQSAATLRHRVWAFVPDVVVYAAYTNDVLPSRVIYTGDPPLPESVSARTELFPRALRERSSLLRHLEGALLVRRVAQTPDYPAFRDAVADIAAQCAAHGVPLVVFAQVPHVAAGLDRADGTCGEACRAQVAVAVEQERIVRGLGVPVASALPYLRAADVTGFPSANAADWEHPSPAGHRVLGAALADVLTRHAAGLPLPGIDPLLAP